MIKNIKVSIKISFLITFIFSIWWTYGFYQNVGDIYDNIILRYKKNILATSKYINDSSKTTLSDISLDLSNRVSNKDLGFYVISNKGKIVYNHHFNKVLEKRMLEFEQYNSLMKIKDAIYTVRQYGDVKFVFGVYVNRKNFVKQKIVEFIGMLAKDASIVFVMCLVFIELFIRRIVALLLVKFSKSTKKSFFSGLLMSKEFNLISRGIDGFSEDYELLRENYKVVEEQIPHAIRKELFDGRKEFETVNCTMVSTDINSSSTIQDSTPQEVYIPIFQEVMNTIVDIVKAYGGNSYKFVGDEIIYYFKDDDFASSATMAVSAVRDINEAVREIENKYKDQIEFRLTTKSSISYGTITFTLVNKIFEIMSGCITEATRILSVIEDKTVNSLYVNKKINDMVEEIVTLRSVGMFSLKGLEDDRELFVYESHVLVEKFYSEITSKKGRFLTYYRSPKDIAFGLHFLSDNLETISEKIFHSVLSSWKTFPSVNRGSEVRDSLVKLLKKTLLVVDKSNEKKYKYYLSSLVAVIFNLVDKKIYDEELVELLLSFTRNDFSRRTAANAVEALGLFDTDHNIVIIKDLLSHDNGRIRSNAIVTEGKKDFSKKIFKRLKQLLRSKKKLFIASGIYTAKEIIVHHKQNKRSYYTNVYFQKILNELCRHVNDDNEMVKRQLERAESEVDDEKLKKLMSV